MTYTNSIRGEAATLLSGLHKDVVAYAKRHRYDTAWGNHAVINVARDGTVFVENIVTPAESLWQIGPITFSDGASDAYFYTDDFAEATELLAEAVNH